MIEMEMEKAEAIPDKIYSVLMEETLKDKPNPTKLAFLTGAVHALRVFNNYKVPEIELSFIKMRNELSEEELKWLLTLFIA